MLYAVFLGSMERVSMPFICKQNLIIRCKLVVDHRTSAGNRDAEIILAAAGGLCAVWSPAGGSIELTCFDVAELKLVLISRDLNWLL